MKLKKLSFLCFVLFAQNVIGQNDNLSKPSLSLNGGINLPINSTLNSGPEFDANLGLPFIHTHLGLDLKAIYMANSYTYFKDHIFALQKGSLRQINGLVGFYFIISISQFSITPYALAGINNEEVNGYGGFDEQKAIYEIGLNLRYSISIKWFVGLNLGLLTNFSPEYYNNTVYLNLTGGVGYRF